MRDQDRSCAPEFAVVDADFGRRHRQATQAIDTWILDLEREQ